MAEYNGIEKLSIIGDIIELLRNDDIESALADFKTGSEEKETAMEFVKAHLQFLYQIAELDYDHQVARKDVEIRDLVSHANLLLKKKYEDIFTAVVARSPYHYREIQKKYYSSLKKEGNEE